MFKGLKLFALAVSLFAAASANAATINLGTTYVGQTGSFSFSSPRTINNTITGIIPNNSLITFSLTMSGFTPGSLTTQGQYNFRTLTTRYRGSSTSTSPGVSSSWGTTNPVGQPGNLTPTSSLVLTSANLTPTAGTGVITNTSIGTANFLATLTGFLARGGNILVTYTVSALSSVPLPAAVWLFGAGLAGLAGLGASKRKKAAA